MGFVYILLVWFFSAALKVERERTHKGEDSSVCNTGAGEMTGEEVTATR